MKRTQGESLKERKRRVDSPKVIDLNDYPDPIIIIEDESGTVFKRKVCGTLNKEVQIKGFLFSMLTKSSIQYLETIDYIFNPQSSFVFGFVPDDEVKKQIKHFLTLNFFDSIDITDMKEAWVSFTFTLSGKTRKGVLTWPNCD
jgi:hypothetical protein